MLLVAYDPMSPSNACVAVNQNTAILNGDYRPNSPDLPPVFKQVFDTRLIERIIVYPSKPRVIELVKSVQAESRGRSWGDVLKSKVFPAFAEHMSGDSRWKEVEMADVCPHYKPQEC